MNIACQLYDYIEIACMYKLEVSAVLKSGELKNGKALNTIIDKHGDAPTECIQMRINGNVENIALNEIAQLHAITDNPHFSSVSF
ncbi:Rho-binding antiterminator [Alteromonas macleodii]|uniref:Transcriptional antiterminator, Rof n=1 Tax=Alteromonas macleodii TaxID=28108 RepID=A0A6T9XW84_ALTMA|nr:Rho-binding antiterminator [Alteromonas macleodii]CAB9492530.1 Transcriptional antiterminator, Rof [Alteromonas macleodii]